MPNTYAVLRSVIRIYDLCDLQMPRALPRERETEKRFGGALVAAVSERKVRKWGFGESGLLRMCHTQHTHESQSRVTSRIFLKVRGGQTRRYNRNLVPRSEIHTCLVSDSDPLFFFHTVFFFIRVANRKTACLL